MEGPRRRRSADGQLTTVAVQGGRADCSLPARTQVPIAPPVDVARKVGAEPECRDHPGDDQSPVDGVHGASALRFVVVDRSGEQGQVGADDQVDRHGGSNADDGGEFLEDKVGEDLPGALLDDSAAAAAKQRFREGLLSGCGRHLDSPPAPVN